MVGSTNALISGPMTSRIDHTTFDCDDAYALSTFWAKVLGFSDVPGDPNEPGDQECMIVDPAGGQQVLFIEVPDDKRVKNRVHFDLVPTDRTVTRRSSGSAPWGPRPSMTGVRPTARGGSCSRSRGQRVLHPAQRRGTLASLLVGGAKTPASFGGSVGHGEHLQGPPKGRGSTVREAGWSGDALAGGRHERDRLPSGRVVERSDKAVRRLIDDLDRYVKETGEEVTGVFDRQPGRWCQALTARSRWTSHPGAAATPPIMRSQRWWRTMNRQPGSRS